MEHACRTPTALAERVAIACPTPYKLLDPVRVLRKELGLTTNDVAVLTALISYLPRDRDGSPSDTASGLTVVFPSNASLSERANGIDERTLRRCLGRIEAAGLIERKNSANGKRFPLRYGGVIRDAFGIDLKPLIQSYNALAAKASELTRERERLRSLKTEALALRASLLQEENIDEERLSTLATVRNILRRATLTGDTVLQIIARLRELGANVTPSYGECISSPETVHETQAQAHEDSQEDPYPNKLSARNGQNVRQKESLKKELKRGEKQSMQAGDNQDPSGPYMNQDPAKMAWENFTHVAGFFPHAPRTGEALNRVLFDIGRLLRISQENLMRGLKKTGAGKLLLILDYLLGKADAIRQPQAYFETILRS